MKQIYIVDPSSLRTLDDELTEAAQKIKATFVSDEKIKEFHETREMYLSGAGGKRV